MLNTGQRLLEWARDRDVGVSSFKRLALANTTNLLLPCWGMTVRKAAEDFSVHRSDCEGESMDRRCGTCAAGVKSLCKYIFFMFQPVVVPMGVHTRIDYTAKDPKKAIIVIIALTAVKCHQGRVGLEWLSLSSHQLRRRHQIVKITDETTVYSGLNNSQRKLWKIQCLIAIPDI